jgi:succinate dehydrogenase / fumarate reductase, cytochrome b subunit
LKWLLNALSSSVGRKFVMAITGLLLCGFLVAHLAGNLLLFVGADAYNAYAHKLHDNEGLLLIAEIGLFVLFGIHLWLAFRLTVGNKLARGKNYLDKDNKSEGDLSWIRPDTWMVLSGLVVLGFICLHLIDFKMEARPEEGLYTTSDGKPVEPFDKAVNLLRTPLSAIGYLVGCVFLFAHLSHGFSSAFQTLGVNHPKYNKLIKRIGLGFAALMAIGFGSFVIWAVSLAT